MEKTAAGDNSRAIDGKRAFSLALVLVPVAVVAVLWALRSMFGIGPGLWKFSDDQLALAAGDDVLSFDGDGISIYFTNPQIEPDWKGGLDEILAADIDRALASVDVAVYDLDLQSVTDALIEAYGRGVTVRVVMEGDNADKDQPQALVAAGIPVIEDGRSPVMHNKFLVIDNSITWTGSWNLTESGTYLNNNNAIRMVSDEVSASYEQEFEEMFVDGAFGASSPAGSPYTETRIGDVRVQVLFSPEDGVMERLVHLVDDAQESVFFMAFSFTDDALSRAMLERAADGVLVEGVFESRGVESDFSEFGTMRETGLSVWKDGNPAVMHHKVIIIDGEIVVTGSFNFSQNASSQNDENLVILYGDAPASQFTGEFDRIAGQARP